MPSSHPLQLGLKHLVSQSYSWYAGINSVVEQRQGYGIMGFQRTYGGMI